MIDILLKNPKPNQWFTNDNAYVRGFIFDENNKFYSNDDLLELFSGFQELDELENIVKNANGHFSVIVNLEDCIFLAVDRLRTAPLFYSIVNDKITISDNAYPIAQKLKLKKIERIREKEFLATGYFTGGETLFKEINQVDSGQIVYIDKLKNNFKNKYYNYFVKPSLKEIDKDDFDSIEELSDRVFKRLIQSVNNKTIVVPLSGGYDSRYIVAMLKKLGYKKVICFSYGKKTSYEAKISKNVAEKLGFEWFFVEYTSQTFKNYPDQDVKLYYRYAHNFSSMPHFQDFNAIRTLKNEGKIPLDSVIVPGHSGDLLRGDFTYSLVNNLGDDLIENGDIFNLIFKYHFNLNKLPKKEDKRYFIQKIKSYLKDLPAGNFENFLDLYDNWDIANRQSKLIINSTRIYEYFGFESRIPLWDNDLSNFWYSVKIKNRPLYNDFLFERLFVKYEIDFLKGKESILIKVINFSKKIFPRNIILWAKIFFKKSLDINNFSNRFKQKISDLNIDPKEASKYNLNYITTLWIYDFMKKEIEKY